MDEKIYLKGRREVIKPMIPFMLSLNQMLRNRDIGTWVGAPLEDDLRSRRTSPLSLKLTYYSVKSPPWKTDDSAKRLIKATYSISSVKRSMIAWDKIKAVMGDANGYDWGNVLITQDLDNGSQMQIYGATRAECKARLAAFLTLTEAAPLRPPRFSDEEKPTVVNLNAKPFKETTRVYPAFFTIINRESVLVNAEKNLGKSGRRKQLTVDLWTPKKPANADAIITEALKPVVITTPTPTPTPQGS